VYSAANEDPASELRALKLEENDEVLCLTGSGARALDLLTDKPKRIVSVDYNAHQSFLLELKLAALRTLDYDHYVSFLGVRDSNRRTRDYGLLRENLSSDARCYWDVRTSSVEKGVLYCGVWERYLRLLQLPFFFRRKLIQELFECEDLSSQSALWFQKWRDRFWVYGLRLISQRFVWRYLLREPGIAFVPKDFPIGDYFLERFDHLAQNHLLKESSFANLLFRGRFSEESLPLHLREEPFQTLRDNSHRIEVVTESLAEHASKHKDRYHAFSLSDFSSYAGPEDYRTIWRWVLHSAKPQARVCERQFLVHYDPQALFPGRLTRDPVLESDLESSDRSFLYKFVCARVEP